MTPFQGSKLGGGLTFFFRCKLRVSAGSQVANRLRGIYRSTSGAVLRCSLFPDRLWDTRSGFFCPRFGPPIAP